MVFHGFIGIYSSEYSQLGCTVQNLTWRVVCLWYLVGLSQLHGKDNTENISKNCSLGVLKRKNIKVQTAANGFILCSLWKVNTVYGEFSSRYKWLKQTTGERTERKREKLRRPRKTTEITVSKPPVHFEVNLFHVRRLAIHLRWLVIRRYLRPLCLFTGPFTSKYCYLFQAETIKVLIPSSRK